MKRNATTSRFLFALGAVLVVSSVLPATAQPGIQAPVAPPPADLIFGEEIDVRVVNLEVVVEDRGGNRIDGLTAGDFQILVDGQEVDVDYFSEILENRAVEAEGGEAPPSIGDGDVVPTNYLFFIDDDHTHVTFRRPVLRGFADQLAELGLRDQVAVVVQSGAQLSVLSHFSADRERTRDALEQLERGRRYGGSLRSTRRIDRMRFVEGEALERSAGTSASPDIAADSTPDLLSGIAEDLGSVDRDLALAGLRLPQLETEAQANALARDLEFSITAVVSTMRALQAPQGRKVLLLLAGAWPTGAFRPEGQGIGIRTDREMLDGLIDTANLLGYTVYPMDQQTTRPSTVLWQNLRYVARDTGGRAFMAGTNLNALSKVSADTANYYWLGFVPEYRRNDQVHDVRVEVLREGLRVRSRRGYLDVSRRAEADMEAQRALLFPGEDLTGPAPVLRVEIGDPQPFGLRKMKVPVTVFVPVGKFPVLPYEDQFLSRLELRFAVVDRNGEQAEIPLIPLDLRGRSKPAEDAVVPYNATLTLRRRPHALVVSVHDPLSRQTISKRAVVAFE